MTRIPARWVHPALVVIPLSLAAPAQTAKSACPAPPAVLSSTQPNIFSEQQEQWLGDAMADRIERYYKIDKDPGDNAYLLKIANRLLAAVPSTKIQFRVVLVDIPVVNAFSIAGGRIYVSRKLVANARNEDEVASVIGHEMGHILSHQFGIETTADLKRLLNVTSVGDRADVYAKFQRLTDARMADKHPIATGNSDEGQDEADTVSVYVIALAGYRPQAFAEFWDRMFFVDGKVGGPLSDLFGVTKPQEKRLRAILKLVNALPPGCGGSQPNNSPEFQKWQALVTANQATVAEASAKPMAEVALNPPLRMQLEELRFSRDGRYILAQDESSISVLSREPYRQLFRFDAEGSLPAEFSPDSQHVVFHTPGLHIEDWNIADRKLSSSHELNTRSKCIQSKLSPDGRTLFCLSVQQEFMSASLQMTVLDVATGDVLFKRDKFFVPTLDFAVKLALVEMTSAPVDLMPSSVSADGNTILIGPSFNKLAFDLRSRAQVNVSKGLVDDVHGAYAFLGNDKVVGVGRTPGDSGLFSFPDGKRVRAFPLSFADLESVSGGDYVVTHSIQDYAVGLLDVSTSKFVLASKAPSIDVWDGTLLNESQDGGVVLHKIGDKMTPDQTATLPISPLGPGLIAAMSDDRRYLALSTRTRGGVWDIGTGERVMLANHFSAASFGPDNTVYMDFPKVGKQERAIVRSELAPLSAEPVSYKVEDTTRLSHGLLLEWKRSDKRPVELIVHDVRDNSVLWRRTFDEGQPAHTGNIVPGQTILAFLLKSDFAKARMAANPALAAEAEQVKNREKGGIVQLIDNRDGKVLDEVVLEIPLDYDGLQGVHVVGDLLYLTGRENRTIVYSMTTGANLRQVFGDLIAADPVSGRICTVNRRDEAVVYDAQGEQLADFHMGSPLRFATFQQQGNRLILLTADQKVRTMDVAATAR